VAYDTELAERVRDAIALREELTEREMFGGIGFMLGGNMACGVIGEDVIVRLPKEDCEQALAEDGVRPFGMPGKRPMTGFILVGGEQLADDASLARWVERALAHAAAMPPK
jgi:TfoX/Sxy family transcriptional regulator of competence genes